MTKQSLDRNRLSRRDWIEAARLVLVRSGIHEVKVDRLARGLKVTRGSFYWHFKKRSDLLDALLHDWEARNYFEIAQVEARWAQSQPDLTEVVAIWLAEDPSFPAFDMAIRLWGRKSATVTAAVHRVDDKWVQLLKELFVQSGYGDPESLVRARIAYFHQIGYYALGLAEKWEERLRLVPFYYQVLTGRAPGPDLQEVVEAARRRADPGSPARRRRKPS